MKMVLSKIIISTALVLCSHTTAAHDHHGRTDDKNVVHEFIPPKLSFSASDYFASLNNNVVALDEDANDGSDDIVKEVPWTIFQAVSSPTSQDSVLHRSGPLLTLFSDNTIKSDTENIIGAYTNNKHAKHTVLTPDEQRAYLKKYGKKCYTSSSTLLSRYDTFIDTPTLTNLAVELWKYCALYVEGGVYVDSETAPLAALGDVLNWDVSSSSTRKMNYVVVDNTRDAGVSPSLLDGVDSSISDSVTVASSMGTGNPIAISSFIAIGSKEHSIPQQMVQLLIENSVDTLEEEALLLPKTLMNLIDEENASRKEKGKSNTWGLLNQRCDGIEIASGDDGEDRTIRHCPATLGYCCEVIDPSSSYVFLLSSQSLVPNQILPSSSLLPQPFALTSGSIDTADTDTDNLVDDKELVFMSTVKEEASSPLLAPESIEGNAETTPNLYEILQDQNALPLQESNRQACDGCLREKKGADCTICAEKCPNFCSKLCEVEVNEKPVKRVLSVVQPRYKKDPERIIPRIVHQTWFEPVTAEKYPNMARLIESWKRSGWEYHFWDDASAAAFLSLHFPPEIREAYDAILPGAFKADLFRYCVLLIKGGIYADMDVMLESNLDAAVPPDVGFMTPVDAPGTKPDRRMCLWNGFIASAPGHPYLSRVIEHVVNNIRNRFTVVDYDRMMCPNVEMSVVHAFSTLFTAGPCILGLTVNEIMGRELQQSFVEGDLESPDGRQIEGVPGRTIILKQNKWDMGAHRFTWVENNLVVAATDMPDYDDRKDLEGDDQEQAAHYSKTQERGKLYGEEKVYTDRNVVDEKIIIKTQVMSSNA